MGGGISTKAIDDIRQDWLELFETMGLTNSEVSKFHKVFNSIDEEKLGLVSVTRVLTMLDIDRTRFNEKIFSSLDKDKSGRVDLQAFVVSLWKFCCLESSAINAFVFEIYDTDADGKISLEQIEQMFRELFGEKGVEQDINKSAMVDLIKKTSFEGTLNLKNFQAFCKTRQMLLSPVFNVQKALQTATLGVKGFETLSNRVLEVHYSRNLPVKEVLALHNDKVLFRALLDTDLAVQVVSDVTRTMLKCTVPNPRYIAVLKLSPDLTIQTDNSSSSTSARQTIKPQALTPTSTSPTGAPVVHSFSVTPVKNSASGKNSRQARSTFVIEGPPTMAHKTPARRTMSQGRMSKEPVV